MEKKPIKVLIVDDSQVARELLKHIIDNDPDLKVIGMCGGGDEAIKWLKSNTPDVITMDVIMPKINGFDITRTIMETKPMPIVIITSAFNPMDAMQGFRAIETGALAILGKPVGFGNSHFDQKAKEITQTIKNISHVTPIRRLKVAKSPNFVHSPQVGRIDFSEKIEAVAIGTSLGGPAALALLISQLNPEFSVPIFIVQHIVPGFTQGLVTWLQTYTKLKIVIPKNQEIAMPGCCYVAPENCHMKIHKNNVISLDYAKDEGIQPSVTQLFKSMAETYGKNCVGVILTGMGKDGAKELLLMKEKGAYTIAQDEKSCVVFGMPAEAIKLGAAHIVLPLDQIPITLNYLISKNVRRL